MRLVLSWYQYQTNHIKRNAQPQASCILHQTWTGDSFLIWYYTCFNAILPNHPPPPSPTESKRLFYTSVSLLLSRIQGCHYHLHEQRWKIPSFKNYQIESSNIIKEDYPACVLSHVRLLAIPWTAARQAPLFMGFFSREYWSGLPFPPPRDLPDPGIKPVSLVSPSLADKFFTTEPLGKPYPPWPSGSYFSNAKLL